jgi:hypothetical protein
MGAYNRKHRHGQRQGQGGGGQGGGGGGGNGGGGGRNAGLGELADPTQTATGKDLVKLARAMAKVEIKPQVRAYRRLIKELKAQQAADTVGLQRLGQQTQSDIQGAANAYDTGAQGATARTQAVGGILQGQLAQQGQAAAAEQQTAQTGTLGGLTEGLQLQGAPQGGAAQAALAELVQQQGARRAAETQAGGQFASSQQGSYGGLLEGMRTAGALQASTSRQQSSRDIASRIAEQRLQAGQDIREAAGKKADVKATKGATILAKLAELRAGERDYILGKRATATTRRGQDITAQTAAASQAAQDARQEDAQAAALDLEAAGDQNEPSTQNQGGPPEGQHARRVEAKKIKNLAQEFVDQYGAPEDRRNPDTAYLKLKHYLLSQEGISNPTLVDRVLRQLGYAVGGQGSSGGGPQR